MPTEDSQGDIFQRTLETDRGEPWMEIIEVISDLEETQPTELPPMYDTIANLARELYSNPPSHDAQAKLEFFYDGYRITLYQEGSATFVKIPDEKA